MQDSWHEYREKIIGLGENSSRKSYYPELQEKIELLEATQNNLETILDSISDGIVLHDLEGRIISLNKRAELLFNIPRSEAKNYTIKDVTSGNLNYDELYPIWNEVIEGNTKLIEWIATPLNSDAELDVQVSLNRAKINNTFVIVGVIRDFSERKNYERLIRKSEERFRKMFENSNDAIFIINRNDQTVFNANRAAEKLISKSISEVYLSRVEDVIPFISSESFEKYLLNEDKKYHEFEFVCQDGTKKNAIVSFGLIEDDYAFINAYDITERKSVEQKLENQNLELLKAVEKAKEMDRLKTIFFANMSHELRTPLVGMLGFSELLQDELNGEYKDFAQKINVSGKRLLGTLNDLLNYSELESHQVEMIEKEIDLITLVNEEIDLFKVFASQKGINLFSDFSITELIVRSDEKLLRGILSNLINNAVKYTNKGFVKVKITNDIEKVVVAIIDTGIGIPKEKYSVIFEEFRQVSEGVSRLFDGTGLGLSIAKKYAQILGAQISVKSEMNSGSTFTLELPLRNSKLNENNVINNSPDNSTKDDGVFVAVTSKKRILVVDDEPLNTEVISLFLRDKYNVDTAVNGNIAITKASQNSYDAILMDVNLKKDMDGLTATRIIREYKDYKTTPIIAVTAFAMQGDKEEFLNAGCSGYLAKPFTKKQLLDTIEDIFK